MKRPDSLFRLMVHYIQIEVDEFGHKWLSCIDEDQRLEIIAADVQLTGHVIRINPDSPQSLRQKTARNGEIIFTTTPEFYPLMDEAEAVIRKCMTDPPEGIVVHYVPAQGYHMTASSSSTAV